MSRRDFLSIKKYRSLRDKKFFFDPSSSTRSLEEKESLVDRICEYQKELPRYLDYHSPFELLIMVILSAQTTDRIVNQLAPKLFARFPDAEHLASASLTEIETLIYSSGFYHAKARHLQSCARELLQRHQGQVPSRFEELLVLPGVGRKTAHAVMGTLFEFPALILDTHLLRLVFRLQLSQVQGPLAVEKDLAQWVPLSKRFRFSMLGNLFARQVCQAKKPQCSGCLLLSRCLFGQAYLV